MFVCFVYNGLILKCWFEKFLVQHCLSNIWVILFSFSHRWFLGYGYAQRPLYLSFTTQIIFSGVLPRSPFRFTPTLDLIAFSGV
jgi:hypothetical protein